MKNESEVLRTLPMMFSASIDQFYRLTNYTKLYKCIKRLKNYVFLGKES